MRVTARVNAAMDKPGTLFDQASFAVRVERMALDAESNVRIGLDGTRRSVTRGEFKGDWVLEFGGQRFVTFRDVRVIFDRDSFKFDIDPERIELHPAVKFIHDVAKQFQPDLPPYLELLKDSNGMPTGVSAKIENYIETLPPLGPITISSILIKAGLRLQFEQGGFKLVAFVGVGDPRRPVFVQFGFLGGGMWITGETEWARGQITSTASLGLAMGATRALNVAGVARGSFSLLVYGNAIFTNGRGTLRAGLLIQGSARIIGFINLGVVLQLEVEHRDGGNSTGRGLLEVEVEISVFYTFRLSKGVEHQL